MKITYVILSIFFLTIGATSAKGGQEKYPTEKVQYNFTPIEDDAVSNSYQPLDKPDDYYEPDDITPEQGTIQQEKTLQQQDGTDVNANEAQTQNGSCACKEIVKKALLQSLQSCINVLKCYGNLYLS